MSTDDVRALNVDGLFNTAFALLLLRPPLQLPDRGVVAAGVLWGDERASLEPYQESVVVAKLYLPLD